MRKIVFILVVCFGTNLYADNLKKTCEEIAHAAAFNGYLERENVCGFDRRVTPILVVIYAKMGCEKQFSDKTFRKFANEAVQDGKDRFKAFGKKEFCAVNRPAYDDVADNFEQYKGR